MDSLVPDQHGCKEGGEDYEGDPDGDGNAPFHDLFSSVHLAATIHSSNVLFRIAHVDYFGVNVIY